MRFMTRLFYLFSLLWCGLFCATAYGATVEGIYEAEVPVSRQSDQQRDKALPEALRLVLVKVTGQSQVEPQIAEHLALQAKRFTQQFRFRGNPEWRKYQEQQRQAQAPEWQSMGDEEAVEVTQDEVVAPEPYLLWVRFDEAMLNQALIDFALPIWGKERPAVLVWLAMEQQGERIMLGGDHDVDSQSLLKGYSKLRGIPLWLPLLDLEDQSRISVSDVWGGFADPILMASQRYQPDVIVLGRVVQLNETIWQLRWILYDQGRQQALYGEFSGLEESLQGGVDLLVDHLAQRYAQQLDPSQSQDVTLRLHGVANLAEYAKVSEYLAGLDGVKHIHLREVAQQQLLIEMELLGDVSALQQILILGKRLRPIMIDGKETNDELDYQLLP